MPSDAFMEVSSLSIKGESGDKAWGKETPYAMFEIANFSFEYGDPTPKDATAATAAGAPGQPGKKPQTPPPRAAPAAGDVGKTSGKMTIQKSIDYASPDLFRRCCESQEDKKKGLINWAILYFREAGDTTKTPYLQIEFRKLQVATFEWDLDPAEGGEAAGKVEKIAFNFETMLIKYAQQARTGTHLPTAMGMWNFAKHSIDVKEIGDDPEDQVADEGL